MKQSECQNVECKHKPAEMCLNKDPIPYEIPLINAPGPLVRPAYGSLNMSATPVPIDRMSPVGLPRISREPTTIPVRVGN